MNFLFRHSFFDIGKSRFCNLLCFFTMAFIYVCLEVADLSLMFTCWDAIELVWYGLCYVYVGVGTGLSQVVPLFAN